MTVREAYRAFEAPRLFQPPRIRLGAATRDWLLASGVFLVVGVHRWWQMGASPPGIDQGHWLAFGRVYWNQANSSLTDLFAPTIMPPLVPGLMAAGTEIFGPAAASRFIAAASIAAVMAACFAVARHVTQGQTALVISVLVGMSATVIEPAAWGGYPQNFAVAALAVTVYSASVFLETRSRSALRACGAASLFLSLSHHAYFGVLVVSLAAAALLWAASRPGWRAAVGAGARLGLALVPSIVVSGIVMISLLAAHYEPAVDASGSPMPTALRYGFPTVPWLWGSLAAVGAVGLIMPWARKRRPGAWRAAVALVAVSSVAFLLTGEARLLPPLVIGLALGVGMAVGGLSQDGTDVAAGRIATVFLLVMLAAAWPSTDRKSDLAFDYYSVLDPSMAAVAEFLDSAPGSGKAAVRTDNRGWPVGWWLRGLSSRPVLVGSDPRWLAFPKERMQAAAVQGLFDPALSAEARRQRALEIGVELLVFRPRDWPDWGGELFGVDPPVYVVYDDGEHLVMAVRGVP